jgi:hypothetical protein
MPRCAAVNAIANLSANSSCSDEWVSPPEFNYTQRIVAEFSRDFFLPFGQSVDANGSIQSILRHASDSEQEILVHCPRSRIPRKPSQ